MKALAWFGKDDVRVIEAPIPDISESGYPSLVTDGRGCVSESCGRGMHTNRMLIRLSFRLILLLTSRAQGRCHQSHWLVHLSTLLYQGALSS